MAYLGNAPGVSSQRTTQTFTATSGQTTFSPSTGYTLGQLDVYMNGVRLVNGTDYTASDGVSVVLASGAALNDIVEIVAYIPRGLSDGYTKPEADARYLGIDAETLPSQTGQSGKYLTTDGTTASWDTVTTPTPAAVSDQANTSTGYFDLPAGTTAQRPGSPASGMVRFNTTIGEPEWYDPSGSQWLRFSQTTDYSVEYLVIAGGGGGGTVTTVPGGGGGAGGYRSSVSGESSGGGAAAESPITVTTGSSYSVTVGLGGAGGAADDTSGSQGGSSSFASITSIGGGGGGGNNTPSSSGGSGGGGAESDGAGGAGTSGQGYAGSSGSETNDRGGGGGGAGEPGGTDGAGHGGDGVSSSITGTPTIRAGGGGSTVGGSGGGGTGSASNPAPGEENTGGGGGGGASAGSVGKPGGKGVVIIRYLGGQKGTGGTVTSSGGYTIHTFTSSGTFTA